MDQNNYTIKEYIEHAFKDMKEKMEIMHDDIKETKVQAQKTNGRVNRHDWYFKAIWWALGAAWTLILIGIPLLYNLLVYDQNRRIQTSVETILAKYKIVYIPNEETNE